ncbi:MAG: hypothetical protein ACLTXI_05135 [Collinsella sp.]
MSFGKFFKDALLPVAVWACGVLLSCFVLTVAGASVSIVVVAVGVSFVFGMLGIVIEYARRRRFLRQLERAAEELESRMGAGDGAMSDVCRGRARVRGLAPGGQSCLRRGCRRPASDR